MPFVPVLSRPAKRIPMEKKRKGRRLLVLMVCCPYKFPGTKTPPKREYGNGSSLGKLKKELASAFNTGGCLRPYIYTKGDTHNKNRGMAPEGKRPFIIFLRLI